MSALGPVQAFAIFQILNSAVSIIFNDDSFDKVTALGFAPAPLLRPACFCRWMLVSKRCREAPLVLRFNVIFTCRSAQSSRRQSWQYGWSSPPWTQETSP